MRHGPTPSQADVRLPGLSVTPPRPEPWWTRPPADRVARRVMKYADLAASCPERRPWLLTGRVVGAGPDHEPLIADPLPLAWLGPDVLHEAAHRYRERFAPGRDSTGRVGECGGENGASVPVHGPPPAGRTGAAMNGPEAFPSELCAEHRAVEALLRRLDAVRTDSGPAPDDDIRLLRSLRDLLDRHRSVEEEHVHPLVRRYLPAGGALADAAVHTHTTIRLLIDRALDRRVPADERHHATDTLLLVLRAHLRGAEDRLFPALRLRAPAEELRRCSRRVRETPPANPPRPVWGLPPGTGAIAAVRDHLTGHDSSQQGQSP
ncbi:DUF6098 family protein [Kitasatospora sp. NPDC094028]